MRHAVKFAAFITALILLFVPFAHADDSAQGSCTTGNVSVVTSGISSATKVMASYPLCTVTVYVHSTGLAATIYSDNLGTAKSNPFTASAVGFWQFFADDGRYDVTMSGGGLPAPVTIYDYVFQDVSASINTSSLTVSGTSTFNGGSIFNGSATFNGTMLDGMGRNLKVWYESSGIVNLQTDTWRTVLGSNTLADPAVKLDVVGMIRAQQNPTVEPDLGNGMYMFYRDADPFTTPLGAGNIVSTITSGGNQFLRPTIISGSTVIFLNGATTNSTLGFTMSLTEDHAQQFYAQASQPAVSASGFARMYFSATTGMRCSVNASAWASCLVDQTGAPVGVGWTRVAPGSNINRVYPTTTADTILLGGTAWSGPFNPSNLNTRLAIVGFAQSNEYSSRIIQLSNFSSSVNTGWLGLGTSQWEFSQIGSSFSGGNLYAQGGSYLFLGTTSEPNLFVVGEDVSQGGGTRGMGIGIGKRTPEAMFDMNGKFWKRTTNNDIMKVEELSELVTVSVSMTTTDTVANLLPANAIILGVDVRVTTTIATAVNWQIGDATTAARFCTANSGVAAGSTAVCLNAMKGAVSTDATGPVQTAAAKVRVTMNATPSAGVMRITVYYIVFSPATS